MVSEASRATAPTSALFEGACRRLPEVTSTQTGPSSSMRVQNTASLGNIPANTILTRSPHPGNIPDRLAIRQSNDETRLPAGPFRCGQKDISGIFAGSDGAISIIENTVGFAFDGDPRSSGSGSLTAVEATVPCLSRLRPYRR